MACFNLDNGKKKNPDSLVLLLYLYFRACVHTRLENTYMLKENYDVQGVEIRVIYPYSADTPICSLRVIYI